MCQAAWAATHTKDTYLSALYQRMKIRKGEPKAVLALAHHMIVIAFNILKRGEEYVELGADHFDRRNKPKTVSRLVQRLTRLGYHVTLNPIPSDEMPVDAQPEIDVEGEQKSSRRATAQAA